MLVNLSLFNYQSSYLYERSSYSESFLEQYANIVFPLVTTTFPIFAVAIVATVLLLLGVFIPHSGEFTRFLHRLGFVYLIYFIWLESSGIVLRFDNVSSVSLLEISQEDSLVFRLFVIYSSITVAIFFFGVAERFFLSKRGRLEFPILVFFLHFGGLFAIRLHTFRDLLIALERVTLASYVFVTFERQNRFSTYAGVQYFILGSLPSARLLLAFGLFYLQGGSLAIQDLDLLFNTVYTATSLGERNSHSELSLIYNYLNAPYAVANETARITSNTSWTEFASTSYFSEFFDSTKRDNLLNAVNPINSLSLRAIFFLFFNLLFKLTAAPFHVWAPSVYGKAPIASVTFLSIYSKARVFFLLFKLLSSFLHVFSFVTLLFFFRSGILSIVVGRVGAFSEKIIKRFFVYSSRGHVGFRLRGLGLATLEGASARFHYLAVYILSSFVMWFLLLTRGRNKTHLSHFAELKNTNPILALLFAFLVFSRSGIPPLGGFFIKLDILAALLDSSHFFTNYVLFFFTVASFFYYLRVIKIIFFDTQNFARANNTISFANVWESGEVNPSHTGRLWIRVSTVSFLSAYIFLVQKPLLALQLEILSTFF